MRSQNTTKVASDNTLTSTLKDGRYYNRTIMKKHITIVGEPHSIFLSHVTAEDGTSLTISNRLMEHLENKSIRTNSLSAIGSDGGVILRVETFLNRPLNWFICMLHLNELPFRHLFLKLDGATTGPKSFTGVLGKKLKDCEKSDMVEFESISCEYFPNLDDYQNKLSQDQKYLYKMCRAIISGTCSVHIHIHNVNFICSLVSCVIFKSLNIESDDEYGWQTLQKVSSFIYTLGLRSIVMKGFVKRINN